MTICGSYLKCNYFLAKKNNKDVFIAQNDQTETPLTKIVKQQTKTFKRNLREKQEIHSKKITAGFFDHYSRAFDVCGILQQFFHSVPFVDKFKKRARGKLCLTFLDNITFSYPTT